jgi:hypothetical protein
MEVSPGEAHGVQAIAINNGVLRLPNDDGALKLEITPALIGSYTRRETDKLISQKIDDSKSSVYEFIPWPVDDQGNPKDLTPEEVVDAANPEGGETEKLYIVAAKPNE